MAQTLYYSLSFYIKVRCSPRKRKSQKWKSQEGRGRVLYLGEVGGGGSIQWPGKRWRTEGSGSPAHTFIIIFTLNFRFTPITPPALAHTHPQHPPKPPASNYKIQPPSSAAVWQLLSPFSSWMKLLSLTLCCYLFLFSAAASFSCPPLGVLCATHFHVFVPHSSV